MRKRRGRSSGSRAIGIGATIDLMGTTVRVGASIRIDQIGVPAQLLHRLEVGHTQAAGGFVGMVASSCDYILNMLANILIDMRIIIHHT